MTGPLRPAHLRLALVGDFALDAYWFLDPARSAPSLETGLPTRPIRAQRYSLGGAANVAANMASLGCRAVHALGVVGRDPWAAEMIRQLGKRGVETSGLIVQERDWNTPVFVKPHVRGRETNRFDTADYNRLSRRTEDALFHRLERLLPRVDIVVVNQQIRDSLHCASFRRRMARFMKRHRDRLIIADTRDYGREYRHAALKLNEHEARRLSGSRDTREAAVRLYRRSLRPVFVTRGRLGCMVCWKGGLAAVPALKVRGRTDTVGAGDSTLAGLALALAAGRNPVEAARFGNLVATVTVRKLYTTGTATMAEVRRLAGERGSGA